MHMLSVLNLNPFSRVSYSQRTCIHLLLAVSYIFKFLCEEVYYLHVSVVYEAEIRPLYIPLGGCLESILMVSFKENSRRRTGFVLN